MYTISFTKENIVVLKQLPLINHYFALKREQNIDVNNASTFSFFPPCKYQTWQKLLKTQITNLLWKVQKYTFRLIRKHLRILLISQKAIKILAPNIVIFNEADIKFPLSTFQIFKNTLEVNNIWKCSRV